MQLTKLAKFQNQIDTLLNRAALKLIGMDIYGNKKPIAIEQDEWWYNGRIIQRQRDNRLPNWISFPDTETQIGTEIHSSKKSAIDFCLKNPIKTNKRATDYI